MSRTIGQVVYLSCMIFALGACSTVSSVFDKKEEVVLEGERLSVLDLESKLQADASGEDRIVFEAPKVWSNQFWPQSGGYPNHSMQHVALSQEPLRNVWSTNIGRGSSVRIPINAQPIVVSGTVYTLDSRLQLSALDAESGKKMWDISLRNKDEDDDAITGGIAYSRNVLYVTTGYRSLFALDPESGEVIWKKRLPAPSRAAPTIIDGRIFVTTLNNMVVAFNAEDGEQLWAYTAMQESAGLVGTASPAAGRDIVVPAFSSGEIYALRVENGTVSWAENLSVLKRAGGLGSMSDIRGLPVIDRGMVIAVSFGGKITAVDSRTGGRVWSRDIGGSSETPWVAGNYVFVLTTRNELLGLERETGRIQWVSQLQRHEKPGNTGSKSVFWKGPILASGRLILVSSDGKLAEVNPETGELVRVSKVKGDIRIAPVVAGGSLLLLDESGTLHAYR